ncbi:MAG: hypothetical protein LAN64_08965 [Acidobacteriia bacterium]|nr:hypothetical protein [Terriglobia bacterium]
MNRREFVQQVGRVSLGAMAAGLSTAPVCGGVGSGSSSNKPAGPAVSVCTPTIAPPQSLLTCRNWISFSPPSPFNPNQNVFPTDNQLITALTQLSQEGWRGLVTYSLDGTLADVPRIAKQAGFAQVIAGLFWFDAAQLSREKAAAMTALQYIDAFVLGNEGLNAQPIPRYTRQELNDELAALQASTGRPVTTSEPFGQYQSDHTLLNLGDWAFPNIHPWFAGIRVIPDAVSLVRTSYETLQAWAPGRTIVVKESWWPTAGDPAATESNQVEFFKQLAASSVKFVWGEAYDQFWKTEPDGQGPNWGFHKSDATPKTIVSALQGVYTGAYLRSRLVQVTSD